MVLDTAKLQNRKEYHIAFNAWKRCRKRIDSQDEHYKGIHDRFLKDQVDRESQLKNWLDRAKVHRDGRVGTARSHVPSL